MEWRHPRARFLRCMVVFGEAGGVLLGMEEEMEVIPPSLPLGAGTRRDVGGDHILFAGGNVNFFFFANCSAPHA